MKSLIHNGVYIPSYNIRTLKLVLEDNTEVSITDTESKLMTIAIAKKLNTEYINDKVFISNFLSDYRAITGLSISSIMDVDWSDVLSYINDEKLKLNSLSKEEKKAYREQKKLMVEQLKSKYGVAIVDSVKLPLSTYQVEPAGIYISKGNNPLRGRWKRSIKHSDIILNLSPDAPIPNGDWKAIVWKPDCMWTASWIDPLTGKNKYVWFNSRTPIIQSRAKAKWNKAISLASRINQVEKLIYRLISSEDLYNKKLGLCLYLMSKIGIRVGDEKIAGEHGTIGCTTLKKSNVKLDGNTIVLDFIGKDYVHWHREVQVDDNIAEAMCLILDTTADDDFLFSGVNSSKISACLSNNIYHGLSAKVFRTYLAGKTLSEYMDNILANNANLDGIPEYIKKLWIKYANLAVAKCLNHKKKMPKDIEAKILNKRARIDKLKSNINSKVMDKISKAESELQFYIDSAGWNLNTSLNNYIDPRLIAKYCSKIGLDISKVYSKSLMDKFSWAIHDLSN